MVSNRFEAKRPASIGAVISDIAELLELQLKLIALNSKEAKHSAVSAAVMAGMAVGLFAVACLFTLGAVAIALHQYTDLAMWSSFGIVGLTCLVIAAVLCVLASKAFQHCTQAWNVSKQELGENIRWLKQSLSRQDAAGTTNHGADSSSTYRPHFERQK